MARKVKFSLVLADGTQVRTLEELREHFDMASVLSYYSSGKLVKWLTDHYYDHEAKQVADLNPTVFEFKKELCAILNVPFSEKDTVNVALTDALAKSERWERLKKFTADDAILAAVDSVAFTQAELADLLYENVNPVYLCGEYFHIPRNFEGVRYIGVNNPQVDVPQKFLDMNIIIENVRFNDKGISQSAKKLSPFAGSSTKLVKDAAKNGDADAMFELANRYKHEADEYNIGKMEIRVLSHEESELCKDAERWFQKASEAGHAEAMYITAGKYKNGGINIRKDENKALSLYKKAAQLGSAEAMYELADFYYWGNCGVEKDERQALSWYSKSAEAGCAKAQCHMGNAYRSYEEDDQECDEETGITPDNKTAVYWFEKAAEQGHDIACADLSKLYMEGYGIWHDNKKAIHWLTRAAELNNADAQYKLAIIFVQGEILDRDDAAAFNWCLKAVENNNLDAKYLLSKFYKDGLGVKRNDAKAEYWLNQAAEEFHFEAQCEMRERAGFFDKVSNHMGIGLLTPIEKLVEPANKGDKFSQYAMYLKTCISDSEKGDYWLKKAAENGHVTAQKELKEQEREQEKSDDFIDRITKLAEDNEEVREGLISLFENAGKSTRELADEGDPIAQVNIGTEYFEGSDSVEQDYGEAVKWFRLAAEQGNAQAQFNLGVAYYYGNGVGKDIDIALKWFHMAADQGLDEAKDVISEFDNNEGKDIASYIANQASAIYAGDSSCVVHSGWINDEIRRNAKSNIVNKSEDSDKCEVDDIVAIIDCGTFSQKGKTGFVFTVEGFFLPFFALSNSVKESIFIPYRIISHCTGTPGAFGKLFVYLLNGDSEPFEYTEAIVAKDKLSHLINNILEMVCC